MKCAKCTNNHTKYNAVLPNNTRRILEEKATYCLQPLGRLTPKAVFLYLFFADDTSPLLPLCFGSYPTRHKKDISLDKCERLLIAKSTVSQSPLHSIICTEAS
jgi:hypothetical protein